MGITRSTLPRNNGNLPLPFFGGNYPIVLLNNMYSWLYMYINWFTRIIFICDCIYYTRYWGWQELSRFSQHNGKLPLTRWKQGNYPVIPIYARGTTPTFLMFCRYSIVRGNSIHGQYFFLWLCLAQLSLVLSGMIYGFPWVSLRINLIFVFPIQLDQEGNETLSGLCWWS